ncbi:MAG: hypothetical protein U0271_30280 [Polyangiaceae bacterium]
MLPSLLPYALLVLLIVATLFVLFLFAYQTPRPGTALVLARAGHAPLVLTSGSRFVLPFTTRAESIDLGPRTIELHASGVTLALRLRPNDRPDDIAALVQSFGATTLNDPDELSRALTAKLTTVLTKLEPAAQQSAEDRVAGIRAAMTSELVGFAIEALDVASA